MRITKTQLSSIIREEVTRALRERMMDDTGIAMQDAILGDRMDAYDALAGALVDAGAMDIDSAMDIVDELAAEADMGPLGAYSMAGRGAAPGGDLETAYMNVVEGEPNGAVDMSALESALSRLL